MMSSSYFRPNAIGNYSFDENNNVVFNKLDKLFDVAVMMDCSQCPIHPTLKSVFTDYAKKNSDIVRAKGAKPVFFMSWAYADKPEMTAQLAEAYTIAGNANNALVIPAGLAFARAVSKQPELNLYVADKRHPSLAGTYLATCVVFAALTGRSPVGNPYTAGHRCADRDNSCKPWRGRRCRNITRNRNYRNAARARRFYLARKFRNSCDAATFRTRTSNIRQPQYPTRESNDDR